ncbi:E3 ubiquitin-protein ligase Mdm2-like [Leptidea sinapis]|uniref:E3 ubiquitin-protein ligase Mdm2-like n=1 Tax=Leptidea sinapis TaxID=189913 RepID=UPI00212FA398|nr:E3 ubiquitin-protein ligase Mdm2-like [Leptidea sinapis]
MNTTASFSSEHSCSRRCSTETIFSIQGKETDFVRDTSDTEWYSSDFGELEPVSSEPEDEAPFTADTDTTDNEIISTKVIEVSVGDDGELQFADSEQTDSEGSDSEMDLYDYWLCAQCRAENNNPLYRYCEKCFKVRKNFFPPRPKRKHRRNTKLDPDPIPCSFSQKSGMDSVKTVPESINSAYDSEVETNGEMEPFSRTFSQDSGVESVKTIPELSDSKGEPEPFSRTFSQDSGVESLNCHEVAECSKSKNSFRHNVILGRHLKRRAKSADRHNKRFKIGSDSDTDVESEVKPLVKIISDPALTIDDINVKLSKKVIADTLKAKIEVKDKIEVASKSEVKDDMCITCLSEPKSAAFIHGRIIHICCCYKCALKVWVTAKRCPVCNCKVSNVLKAVVV